MVAAPIRIGRLVTKTNRKAGVLVYGDEKDPHTQAVVEQLDAASFISKIIDAWKPWGCLTIGLEDDVLFLVDEDGRLPINGIWNRLKPSLGTGYAQSEAFALRERREFLFGLSSIVDPSVNKINDPYAQERSRNKIFQLKLAKEVGFETPRTWISTDVQQILKAEQKCDNGIIYKPMTWLASLKGQVLFTNIVSPLQIRENKEAVRVAPGIYQERIVKKVEYRVMIVDQRIFAVRIHSQELADTQIDWRRNQKAVRYELCTLEATVQERLLRFHGRSNLRYGAYDLIETPKGNFVFLEVNPAGNWLWLEEKLNLPISKAIAEALVN